MGHNVSGASEIPGLPTATRISQMSESYPLFSGGQFIGLVGLRRIVLGLLTCGCVGLPGLLDLCGLLTGGVAQGGRGGRR
jgi:hypothetical protein